MLSIANPASGRDLLSFEVCLQSGAAVLVRRNPRRYESSRLLLSLRCTPMFSTWMMQISPGIQNEADPHNSHYQKIYILHQLKHCISKSWTWISCLVDEKQWNCAICPLFSGVTSRTRKNPSTQPTSLSIPPCSLRPCVLMATLPGRVMTSQALLPRRLRLTQFLQQSLRVSGKMDSVRTDVIYG